MKLVGKKVLVLLVLLAGVSFLMASSVEMWHSLMGSKRAAGLWLFENFTKQTGIQVKEVGIHNILEWHQKVLSAVAIGNPPDLAGNHYYFLPQYVAAGVVEPLDDYFKEWGIDPEKVFPKAVLETVKYNGKIYGIPLFFEQRVILWNKDLFREEGLDPDNFPETWEELIEIARKLTKWENGKLIRSGLWLPKSTESWVNVFSILLWGYGGDFFDENGKAIFNSEAGVKALTLIRDMFNKYKLSTPEFGQGTKGATNPYITRQAVIVLGAIAFIQFVKDYAPDMDFGVTFPPKPKGGKFALPLDPFVIFTFKNARHKKEALEFLRYLCQKETQVQFAKQCSRLPALIAAFNDPVFKEDPLLMKPVESLNFAKPLPALPQWPEIQDTIFAAISKVIHENSDPKKALDEAAKKVNEILAKER